MSYDHDRRDIALKNANIKFGWAIDEIGTAIQCADATGDDAYVDVLTEVRDGMAAAFQPVKDHLAWLIANGRRP